MNWIVPLADINFNQDEYNAVARVLRSGWLSMGEINRKFEQLACEYLNVKYAFAVTNGTAALHLANLAIGLGPGDEVIMPSLTFVATANSVLYTGAKPVFADITSLNNLTVSTAEVERLVGSKTRSIMVMHYGGYPCAMKEFQNLSVNKGISLIEDAAHAIGSKYNETHAGTLGDVGCFSFFANKNLTTGEGGLLVTNRGDIADQIRLLRSHGMNTLTWDRYKGHAFSYDVVSLGFNYRMDELRAALGIVQLQKLDANNERRREIVDQYRCAFINHPMLSIPFLNHLGSSSCHLFVILLNNPLERQSFIEHLRNTGIQTSLHYPPIDLFSYYQSKFGSDQFNLPLTHQAARRLVTLPLFPSMSDQQINHVITSVNQFNA